MTSPPPDTTPNWREVVRQCAEWFKEFPTSLNLERAEYCEAAVSAHVGPEVLDG